MAYLMIENKGVAPIEAFTVLGATTKRDIDIPGVIGTFGSGGNMATLDLLRHDLYPVMYCGRTGLSFSTKSLPVEDVSGGITHHRQVYVKFSGTSTRTEKLSWTIAYGSADWGSVDFALREYTSNAIDAMLMQGVPLKEVWKHVTVEIVEDNEVCAARGGEHTRVFVPVNQDVRHFMDYLEVWFLHIGEPESLGQTILEKNGRNIAHDRGIPLQRAVIYRRGVRVREFESDTIPSLYDYNLDDLRMNESRTVDDWIVQQAAGQALKKAPPQILARVFKSLVKGATVWEARLPEYALQLENGDNKEGIRQSWEAALKMLGDNAVIVSDDADRAKEQVKRKGFKPISVPAPFADAARQFEVPTDDKVLTEDDRAGREFFEPNEPLLTTMDRVWAAIEKHGMTNGKPKPKCKLFFEHMNAECEKFGFYRDGTVFVHRDYATACNDALDLTVLEEDAHHITGATDCSRDFQQWLMRFLHVAVLK